MSGMPLTALAVRLLDHIPSNLTPLEPIACSATNPESPEWVSKIRIGCCPSERFSSRVAKAGNRSPGSTDEQLLTLGDEGLHFRNDLIDNILNSFGDYCWCCKYWNKNLLLTDNTNTVLRTLRVFDSGFANVENSRVGVINYSAEDKTPLIGVGSGSVPVWLTPVRR